MALSSLHVFIRDGILCLSVLAPPGSLLPCFCQSCCYHWDWGRFLYVWYPPSHKTPLLFGEGLGGEVWNWGLLRRCPYLVWFHRVHALYRHRWENLSQDDGRFTDWCMRFQAHDHCCLANCGYKDHCSRDWSWVYCLPCCYWVLSCWLSSHCQRARIAVSDPMVP